MTAKRAKYFKISYRCSLKSNYQCSKMSEGERNKHYRLEKV